MPYQVYRSDTFVKELKKMPGDFTQWVEKVEDQLMVNPYVGDQLRVPWFREKKKDKFRVYYLIYDNLQAIYLVAISAKKDQQAVINTVFFLLDEFKEQIQHLVPRN